MLVLTRKMGEGIVLPNCNVTVTVVAISRNRVRLGIKAPLEVAVCRHELWEREQSLPEADSRHPQPAGGDGDSPSCVAEPSLDDDRLVEHIVRRAGGRIDGVRVEMIGERIVVHGRAESFYGRQLAQAAVLELLHDSPDGVEPQAVEFEIAVP